MAALSFDCPTGPRELIANGTNGLLARHLDVADLADGLARLMDDAALRARLGQAAMAVRSEYSIDRIAGLWLKAVS